MKRLAVAVLAGGMMALAGAPAALADSGAFTCTAATDFITPSHQLFTVPEPLSGAPTSRSVLGAGTTPLNALGFDANNGFLYSISAPPHPGHLLRIDNTGKVTDLGPVAGLPAPKGTQYVTGAFDSSKLWVLSEMNPRTAYGINVTMKSVDRTLTLSAPLHGWDWTFSEGYMWALNDRILSQVNLSTGEVRTVSVDTLGGELVNQQFNAAWTFANGDLGFLSASGDVFTRVSVGPGPLSSLSQVLSLATYTVPGFSAGINDGASCQSRDPAIHAWGNAYIRAVAGTQVCTNTAAFTDPDSSATASEYSATIDWGDGTTSTGTIIQSLLRFPHFEVQQCHTYTGTGPFTISTTIVDVDNPANGATVAAVPTVLSHSAGPAHLRRHRARRRAHRA